MKILNYSRICHYKKVNGLYVLENDVFMDIKHDDVNFRIQVDKGAMTDGLSVPKIFRWYLKDWDDDNPLYNIAGIIHDGCYGSEIVTKPLADEIFYYGLLKAGISKTKAKIARWAVENLTGLHYGRKHDDYGISEYVHLDIV